MTESPLSEFDVEPEVADALQSVFDKPPVAVDRARKAAEYKTLAADTRKLSLRQRLYIRHLLASQMRQRVALNKMNAGLPFEDRLKESTVRNWHRRNDFRSIVERYAQLALEQSGVGSSAQILVRIDGVVEDALTPVPMYHNGIALRAPDGSVQTEVDRGNALKGLELLGKAAGTFRKDEENSTRVTVVLDFSGEQMQGEQESEIVDGDFEVVR